MVDIHLRLWLNLFVTQDSTDLDFLALFVRFQEIGMNIHQLATKVINLI